MATTGTVLKRVETASRTHGTNTSALGIASVAAIRALIETVMAVLAAPFTTLFGDSSISISSNKNKEQSLIVIVKVVVVFVAVVNDDGDDNDNDDDDDEEEEEEEEDIFVVVVKVLLFVVGIG